MSGTGTMTSFTRGEDPLRADKLNQAFSERVSRAGDMMNGYLTLVGDPTQSFHSATKQYVDRLYAVGLPPGGPFLPSAGGTTTGLVTMTGAPQARNLAIIDTSTTPYPNVPDTVPDKLYVQFGPESASTQLQYWYPNHNRSQLGLITAALTVMPGGPAFQQSPFYGSVSVRAGVGIAIQTTAVCAGDNTVAYGAATQCTDTTTGNDQVACLAMGARRVQNEYDCYAHNPNTVIRCSLNSIWTPAWCPTPTIPSGWIAYAANAFSGSTGHWGQSFASGDGGADCALYVGMQTSPGATRVPGFSSQTVEFDYTDTTASTQRSVTTQVFPLASGCNFRLTSSYSGRVNFQIQNLAALMSQSSVGADLNMMYVNGSNALVVGDGIGRTIIKGSNGNVAEFFTTGTAFNDVSITSVANGSAPTIASHVASGGTDTNVGLNINAFGTGVITLGSPTRINGNVGFNTAPIAKPNVTGAWAGNTAGKALSTALAALGLITDSTTA
jgi:hypothetical protein